jgi:hypothetical protein
MKTNLSPIVSTIRSIILTFAAASFLAALASAQGQPSASRPDNEAPQFLTNAPPPGFATRVDYLKSFTSEKDILNARRAGLINEDESMLAMGALDDKMESKPMDIYGQVVDQSGQPVVGVKVQGYVRVGIGDDEEHDTDTDSQGRFHFLGLRGQGLGIRLQKQGYEYGYKIPYRRPENYLPDPNNPAIITMWKLRGAEPMVHIQINSDVPCDGSVKRFDLLSNKQNNSGDLIVKLTRNPINIDRRKPFDWSVTLEITNGGLQAVTNLYPNEAPAQGYQPSLTLDFSTNAVGWKNEIHNMYYFKSNSGQVYGRIVIHILADRPRPPTYFDAEIYANPAGSRNLEFDPQKQIH